ncbi:TonB-dependent receptor [Aquimarina algicola]|uniref:TonB-dependent receptor n=1 Tax=Aquimarina algicola TaxID=2589995 RepID=UPI001CF0D70E|nr:carboxypeptidase-like regulatory domain-containing protein [Aquimarina algicola]
MSELYHVTFSYNPNEVNKISEIQVGDFLNFEEAIQSIEIQTQLRFEKVDNQNYVILKSTKKNIRLICGKVVDENYSAIAGVLVKTSLQHTVTNLEGFFYLEITDQPSLIDLSAYGFKTKSISTSFFKSPCKQILLEQEIVSLDEVIIRNYLAKGLTKNEDGSINVKMQQTGVLPGIIEPDAIQTLQFIPGLQSPDETVTGLHIRGSTPDQNLILYDGVKMYQDAHFFGLLSVFNPYMIDNIKLFRSATKSKYGGHAGGVISIGVDESIPKKMSIGIGATLTHVNSDIKIPLLYDKLAIFASARRGTTDFINTITTEKYAEVAFQNTNILDTSNDLGDEVLNLNFDFLYEDYYTKLIFKPYESLQFNFGFLKNQNNLLFEGTNPFFKSNTDDKLRVESETLYESVSYQSQFFGSHNLQLSFTSFNKKYSGLNDFDIASQQPTLLEITFDKENEVKETSVQYNGEKKLFKNGIIQFGYQRNRSEVSYIADSYGLDLRTFQEFFKGKETSQSFFSDFKFRGEKLQLNLGGRRQYFNRLNDVFWEPRAFLNYKLLPKLWMKISYEEKHQSISQITDLRNDGLGNLFNQLWVVSTDESIPVIKNQQLVVGFDFQRKGWTVDVETYIKKLEGIGILLTDNIFSPRNVSGTNRIKGIDILLKKKWRNYGTWFSYSFADNKYQFEEINNNRPFQGSFDIKHSLVWTHTLTFKNINFAIGYRHRTGIPYTQKNLDTNNPQSNFIVFEKYNGERLPDYHRVDLTADYNFYLDKAKKIKTRIGFALQNITNERNVLSRDFRVLESNNENNISQLLLERVDRYSIGFTPNFIIRCNL